MNHQDNGVSAAKLSGPAQHGLEFQSYAKPCAACRRPVLTQTPAKILNKRTNTTVLHFHASIHPASHLASHPIAYCLTAPVHLDKHTWKCYRQTTAHEKAASTASWCTVCEASVCMAEHLTRFSRCRFCAPLQARCCGAMHVERLTPIAYSSVMAFLPPASERQNNQTYAHTNAASARRSFITKIHNKKCTVHCTSPWLGHQPQACELLYTTPVVRSTLLATICAPLSKQQSTQSQETQHVRSKTEACSFNCMIQAWELHGAHASS